MWQRRSKDIIKDGDYFIIDLFYPRRYNTLKFLLKISGLECYNKHPELLEPLAFYFHQNGRDYMPIELLEELGEVDGFIGIKVKAYRTKHLIVISEGVRRLEIEAKDYLNYYKQLIKFDRMQSYCREKLLRNYAYSLLHSKVNDSSRLFDVAANNNLNKELSDDDIFKLLKGNPYEAIFKIWR